MSVRAYRVNNVETQADNTFNLWHDEDQKLCLWLEENSDFYEHLNNDSCGFTEVPVETLKEALKKVKLNPETRKYLKKDIAWAKKRKLHYLNYECF